MFGGLPPSKTRMRLAPGPSASVRLRCISTFHPLSQASLNSSREDQKSAVPHLTCTDLLRLPSGITGTCPFLPLFVRSSLTSGGSFSSGGQNEHPLLWLLWVSGHQGPTMCQHAGCWDVLPCVSRFGSRFTPTGTFRLGYHRHTPSSLPAPLVSCAMVACRGHDDPPL